MWTSASNAAATSRFYINRLRQTTWTYWSNRDGADSHAAGPIDGPKCILTNQYAGSGGDASRTNCRQQGLGPPSARGTWAGWSPSARISPRRRRVVRCPTSGVGPEGAGSWNHGRPDMEVRNSPDLMVSGQIRSSSAHPVRARAAQGEPSEAAGAPEVQVQK